MVQADEPGDSELPYTPPVAACSRSAEWGIGGCNRDGEAGNASQRLLSCFDTELIGKVVKVKRTEPSLLAECECDCERGSVFNAKGSRNGLPFVARIVFISRGVERYQLDGCGLALL
jgi:hypothetical protein